MMTEFSFLGEAISQFLHNFSKEITIGVTGNYAQYKYSVHK